MRYRREIPSSPAALEALAVLSLLPAAPPSAVGQARVGGLQEAGRTVRSLVPDAIFFTQPMQSVWF
jgi:hypothetical protein